MVESVDELVLSTSGAKGTAKGWLAVVALAAIAIVAVVAWGILRGNSTIDQKSGDHSGNAGRDINGGVNASQQSATQNVRVEKFTGLALFGPTYIGFLKEKPSNFDAPVTPFSELQLELSTTIDAYTNPVRNGHRPLGVVYGIEESLDRLVGTAISAHDNFVSPLNEIRERLLKGDLNSAKFKASGLANAATNSHIRLQVVNKCDQHFDNWFNKVLSKMTTDATRLAEEVSHLQSLGGAFGSTEKKQLEGCFDNIRRTNELLINENELKAALDPGF